MPNDGEPEPYTRLKEQYKTPVGQGPGSLFLKHAGPTDVIAFGYTADHCRSLHGEIFICVDEALRQARRFRTTWQRELVRYLAHGLLHFQGYDDKTPAKRGRMKLVENALVQELSGQFSLSQLSRKAKVRS